MTESWWWLLLLIPVAGFYAYAWRDLSRRARRGGATPDTAGAVAEVEKVLRRVRCVDGDHAHLSTDDPDVEEAHTIHGLAALIVDQARGVPGGAP